MKNPKIKELLTNKKNERLYKVIDSYECGLVLNGLDLKKILNYQVSLNGSHGWIIKEEIWLRGLFLDKHIKLLLNKWEILKIIKVVKEKKYLLIPKNLYLKNYKAKITLMVAKRNQFTNKSKLEKIKRKDEKKYLTNCRLS